jgi:hypothetical protein
MLDFPVLPVTVLHAVWVTAPAHERIAEGSAVTLPPPSTNFSPYRASGLS